jgi:hypothetical protein
MYSAQAFHGNVYRSKGVHKTVYPISIIYTVKHNNACPDYRDVSIKFLDRKITNELITMTRTVLEQNYFTFKNKTYFQLSGLAMGAPSSGILSEVYLQNLV